MFFPTWEAIAQHEEVITFVCGLTSRPDELFEFISRKAATLFEDKHSTPIAIGWIDAVTAYRNMQNDLCQLEKFMKEIATKQSDRSSIPKIQNRHVCLYQTGENFTDPVLNKVYICGNAIFCQDPKYQSHMNSDDDKEHRYVIAFNDSACFQPICSLIQKLRESNQIHITRVYSPDMCLEEKDIHEDTDKICSVLEGNLTLDTSGDKVKSMFCIIEEIAKFQTIFINDLRVHCLCSENRTYFRQIINLVSFSKDMKSFSLLKNFFDDPDKDHMLSHSLISLMARKLYGNCEMKGPEQIKRARLNTAEGSSLECLSLQSFITGEDMKILIRPNLLTRLRKLDMKGLNIAETFGEILGLGYPNLEMLCLLGSYVSQSDIYILAETLRNGGLPVLKCIDLRHTNVFHLAKLIESAENVSSEMTETCIQTNYLAQTVTSEHFLLSNSNIGTKEITALLQARQLKCLVKLELTHVTLTNHVADLLGSGFPSLVRLDLSSAKLNRTDVDALTRVRWPSLKILDLSKNILTSCVGELLGISTSTEQQTKFPCLQDLNLSSCNLSGFDLEALCTGLRNGRLSQLRKLDVHDMNPDMEEDDADIFSDLSESWKEHYKRHQKEIDVYCPLFYPMKESPKNGGDVRNRNLPGLILFVRSPVWKIPPLPLPYFLQLSNENIGDRSSL